MTATANRTAEDLPLYPEDVITEGPQGCRRVDYPDGSGAYETPPPPHITRRHEWQAAETELRTAITDLLQTTAEVCPDCFLPGNDNHAPAIAATEAIARLLQIHAPENLHNDTAHRIQEIADRQRHRRTANIRENYRKQGDRYRTGE